jgi:hypothetical protein
VGRSQSCVRVFSAGVIYTPVEDEADGRNRLECGREDDEEVRRAEVDLVEELGGFVNVPEFRERVRHKPSAAQDLQE